MGDAPLREVWIEAALNGPGGKARQPGIPDDVATIVAEGIACAKAGGARRTNGGPR